eukprot:IDg17268t1
MYARKLASFYASFERTWTLPGARAGFSRATGIVSNPGHHYAGADHRSCISLEKRILSNRTPIMYSYSTMYPEMPMQRYVVPAAGTPPTFTSLAGAAATGESSQDHTGSGRDSPVFSTGAAEF